MDGCSRVFILLVMVGCRRCLANRRLPWLVTNPRVRYTYVRKSMSGMKVMQCNHGFATNLISCENNHPVSRFLDTFFMNWSRMSSIPNLRDTFTKHQEIWNDESHRKMSIDIFTAIGTNFLLIYKVCSASNYTATAILALENYDGMGNIESSINSRRFATKLRDMNDDGSSVETPRSVPF